MFTGLIDDIGTVKEAAASAVGLLLRVDCRYDDLSPGESIAINGACLTVRECAAGWFTAAAVDATLSRTTIGQWRPGTRVNLERAMRADSRFGGHIVQGHVDGIAVVREAAIDEGALELELPPDVDELTVSRGSIAVDGVSLTVQQGPSGGVVRIALIDFTLRHTTLGDLARDDRVHVESDVVGKYVRRLLDPYLGRVAGDAMME